MPTRSAKAEWQGSMKEGNGTLELAQQKYPYSFKRRMNDEEHPSTNPEELIAAAQAGCYSMALSARLSQQGFKVQNIETTCKVTLSMSGIGMKISRIAIHTKVKAPNLTQEQLQQHAKIAKDNCPVSNALLAVGVMLDAKLVED
ncbi:MAG: OsmC family peroxiredoxin [Anaerolineae bacterium]|nr:OsmC family peroxiredoxin [Anaerolineae bacterium]MDQ7036509.1 OsmC family peroxiredoxin [Anaerolineae bacterium]